VNFTREPLIETVITPKEGYKLVVRNSKVGGQEEYFVDAVEVVSIGSVSFFRSLEKPKCFLVPVTDFEILEARETRITLKTPGATERGIKIAGGREAPLKVKEETLVSEPEEPLPSPDTRPEKRREKRRLRKRRGKDEEVSEEVFAEEKKVVEKKIEERRTGLIPPPSTLISETITRYKTLAAEEPEIKEIPHILVPPPLPPRDEDEEIPF
jgi:hypothetical protein